jgi:alkane 1-monooxygenase
MDAIEEAVARKDYFYDFVIYAMVPIQYWLLWVFLERTRVVNTPLESLGILSAFGLSCGILGINVAHELGHRTKKYEQWMSKSLLLTSLYMHFFVEHNRGHHKHVSTPEDPASSQFNEPIYTFFIRSIIGSYISAWKINTEILKKNNKSFFSGSNEMFWFQLLQTVFVLGIFWYYGPGSGIYFIVAAFHGILLLESVNYIEHYGLMRQKKGEVYEKVKPIHSWNSNHPFGRLLLFELSRHSDHHYQASRKYQILRHFEESPQMPTGYPGMIVLALIPPLWFKVMNKRVLSVS